MPIKNYTTVVPVQRTVLEIQEMLADHGAQRISLEYEGKEVAAVFFEITLNEEHWSYRLPCRRQKILRLLQQDEFAKIQLRKSRIKLDERHARAVGWRIVRDWLDAQLAIVEAEMVDLQEVMLPYMLLRENQTVYDNFREQRAERLLEAKTP
jgi:hypothetical protein